MTGLDVARLLADVPTVGLDGLGEADLQQRVDRKYLLRLDQLAPLVDELASTHRVLEVGGLTSFAYSSAYLDTADLRCFHDHRQGRRLRWKARTRVYRDSGRCRFEVKLKTGRGHTDKHALLIAAEQSRDVPEVGRRFLASLLNQHYRMSAPLDLHLSLVVDHLRSTLVAIDGSARLTVDSDLTFNGPLGTSARMRQGLVLLETKSIVGRSHADRVLWSAGIRPASVSKYCVGVALTDPRQPDQPWRRLLQGQFHPVATATAGGVAA